MCVCVCVCVYQGFIDIEVFDWDLESDDFLGRTRLDLEDLCTHTKEMQPVETWYKNSYVYMHIL